MNKFQKILLFFVLIGVFALVYGPHLGYPYPFHVDEWHHITEALRFQDHGAYFQFIQPELSRRFSGLEIGFHLWLFLISKFFNLILIYKFLPAIWAVFSAGVLFFVVYRKSDNNFLTAILSVLLFASIKSDANLTGIWFYSPLAFCIPFIYLYLYFFSEGIEKQSKKLLLISFAIMLFLIPFHPLSVLFSLPLLVIYSLINFKYIIKEWKIFSILGLAGLIGLVFFAFILKLNISQVLPQLFDSLVFKHGWGVLELNNSLTSIYSLLAWIYAILGVILIFVSKQWRKYGLFVLWPITLLISIFLYKIWGVSYVSPFQRNLYYLTISLPLLGALGFGFVLVQAKRLFMITLPQKLEIMRKLPVMYIEMITNFFIILIFVLSVFLMFQNYYTLPREAKLYKVIDKSDYEALIYLSKLPTGSVMAPINIGTALFALSGHEPVAAIAFYGNREILNKFTKAKDCNQRNKIMVGNKIGYIYWHEKIDCSFAIPLKQIGNNYIYKINLP